MIDLLNKNEGYALLMALLLLVVVGTLVGALMTAGVFNIQFRTDESTRAQAFYAAEAGIEYVKDEIKDDDFELNDLPDEWNDWIELNDNFEFKLSREGNSNTIVSTGRYRGSSMLRRGSIEEKLAVDLSSDGLDMDGIDVDIPFHLDQSISFHNSPHSKELDNLIFRKIYGEGDIKPSWDIIQSIDKSNFIDGIKGEVKNELIFINDDYHIKHNELNGPIKNSVIIINGDLDIQTKVEIKDSYLFVNGDFEINGAPNSQLTRSLFFMYGDGEIKINGNWDEDDWNLQGGPNRDINEIGTINTGNFKTTNWRRSN